MAIEMPPLVDFDPEHESLNGCVFVFAHGFEDRALAAPSLLAGNSDLKPVATIGIRYGAPKGPNRVEEGEALVRKIAASGGHVEIPYNTKRAALFEYSLAAALDRVSPRPSLIAIDISAMSKFLILVSIVVCLSRRFDVRVIYTEAEEYSPSFEQFDEVYRRREQTIRAFAGQPTIGVSSILRSSCLSSTRMQGQPTCAIAFTSFNEELIRHAVGTMNPHRLLLINGIPPHDEFGWRARATQAIHGRLIDEHADDNRVDVATQLLYRSASTLYYAETAILLFQLHGRYGLYERMVYFATGSKMQTVGLALLRACLHDAHIEYPTPDSYFFEEYSRGIGDVHQVDLHPELCSVLTAGTAFGLAVD